MSTELDSRRLRELRRQMGLDVPEIAGVLASELGDALAGVDAGLRRGDLEAVALAGHAARNSALMIDARPLLAALRALESAARAGDAEAAAQARDGVGEHWPGLRAALQRAAGGDR